MAGRSWARWHWPPTMAGQTRPLARRAVALAPSHGRARCPRPPERRRGGPGAAAPRQGRGSMGPRRTAAPPARAAAPPAPRRSGGVDSNAVAATTSSELEVAAGGCGRRFPSRHCCSSWLRYRRAISFFPPYLLQHTACFFPFAACVFRRLPQHHLYHHHPGEANSIASMPLPLVGHGS